MKRDVIGRVAPWIQMNWDGRAAGNFIGGGTGSGLLVWAVITGLAPARFPLALGMACVGAGLLCVWAEIGRPWRALNVFRHARTSWMTREAFAALGLYTCGSVAVLGYGGALARGLLVAFAAIFLYCQARMLQAAKGIPAWRHRRVVPLIVVTGLTEGAALLWLTGAAFAWSLPPPWFGAALVLLPLARSTAWWAYRRGVRRAGAPRGALAALDRFHGPLIAADLIAAALAAASLAAIAGSGAQVIAAGLALVAGWMLKLTIIRRAAFNQGFALVLAPERGVGGSGPPARPGW